MDQYLHVPKSQSQWYGIHMVELNDPTGSGKYSNTWLNDAAKHNSAFGLIAKPSAYLSTQPSSRPLSQDTLHKCKKAAKETSYIM